MCTLWQCCVSLAIFVLLASRGVGADAPPDMKKIYGGSISGTKELLGYWPLAGNLKAAAGGLELASANPKITPAEGPFGGFAVDLSDGNYLSVQPCKEFEAPQMGAEMMFEILKPTAGNLCLMAIRSEKSTRLSLHYNPDTNLLLLYNGAVVSRFLCNDSLAMKEWFHLAMGVADGKARVWLNGKECESQGEAAAAGPAKGLPFVVGASNSTTGAEHADIKVAHLAIYKTALTGEEIVSHVKAAGWGGKLKERFMWQKSAVSILESQIGYHPRNIKHVYLRSAVENPPAGIFEPEFMVIDAKTDKEVFRGKVNKWGKKWDTFWWVLDFTPLRQQGSYYVKTGKLISSKFKVEDGIFHKTDLAVIALDQLEHRIHQGVADKRSGLQGLYVHCPPETRIYMDCGSPYSELEPVGTCVYALIELHKLLGGEFSEKDRTRMINLAAMGADYFVAAQRKSDDPEIDGMFYHSLLVNTHDTWAGSFSTYLDAAYGMALLAKSHQFFKLRDPKRAERYLEAAKKAWNLCSNRPYHTRADRTIPDGCNAYFWNAPAGIQDTFGRSFYNILDKTWKMPDALRTRDRLPFIQGSALLYEITGEIKYLAKAIEFADVVAERQFTDWENPIDGCFGTFYEFEGNDEAFFHEFMQGGFWWEGNVEALNLEGFMQLLRLSPANPKAAIWQNTIVTYAENYARKATTLNPLGIYPVACYKDPDHGGIKNFQNTLMGATCLFGFSAKNFMLLGDFLKDSSFQAPALAGVNFIGGLNPGVPNAYQETAWNARTLIQGVGRSWFGPAGDLAETAKGSVPNGFCAAPQFWQPTFDNFISYQTDKPRGLINQGGGLQFNEGWILHSHAYVHAVARLEAGYSLNLITLNDGKPVAAGVAVDLTETEAPHSTLTRTYQTNGDGTLGIADLPTPCNGMVHITHNGSEIIRPLAAIAGANPTITVDFSQDVDLKWVLPEKLVIGATGEARVQVHNSGAKAVTLKLALSASGLRLSQTRIELVLPAGTKQDLAVPFECGRKVMPCLLRAFIEKGAPPRDFLASARIGSK